VFIHSGFASVGAARIEHGSVYWERGWDWIAAERQPRARP
jgi:hypothetical protein